MEKIVKLIRISSKEAFKKLRNVGEIECKDIGKSFKITNLFLRHISGITKNRGLRSIIERLSSINLIELISFEGKLVEKRENIIIEGYKKFNKSYKIRLIIGKIEFFIILGEKVDGNIILISVFLNYLE